jgi:hypothetical protein
MSSTTAKKKPSVKNSLKPSDICRIIEACKSSGVRDFQMGSLHIQFGEAIQETRETWNDFAVNSTNSGTQTESVDQQSARKLSEEEIDQLKLTDPAAYERLLLSGELDGTEI